ncbi:MAG: hypothetical protein J7647_19455 [Cyanobacteria bacterium SBLK]|nr:hypothetical protein [Cyanobacteria bacterium SBLK]
MNTLEKGFITILTGTYAFQDCIHFLTSVRKFHQEPILILINRVPRILYPCLTNFGNILLKEAPDSKNVVLSSRLAKFSLEKVSPFTKTVYLDNDICLLSNIDRLFDWLDEFELLLVKDVRSSIASSINLLRIKQDESSQSIVLPTLQSLGFPLTESSAQFNGGMIAFSKSDRITEFFSKTKEYFDLVLKNQEILYLRDQGAFASALEVVKPNVKFLPYIYNYMSMYKSTYPEDLGGEVKVLHCTYEYRPQYAKEITRTLYTRIFDRLAQWFLPQRNKNPWRKRKASNP